MITMPFAARLAAHVRSISLPLLLTLALSGCIPRLVQPYDEALVVGTEALYAEAAAMIDDGVATSPRTDAERDAIRPPTKSGGHVSHFAPRYDALIRASDLMILRAMAGSDGIDKFGQKLQGKIEEAIENAVPSVAFPTRGSARTRALRGLADRGPSLACVLAAGAAPCQPRAQPARARAASAPRPRSACRRC